MISHSKPYITEDDVSAVSTQLTNGHIANGKKVLEFEDALKDYLSFRFAKFVDSGSKALRIALQALGVSYGDEVILPSYVCHNVIDAVTVLNATPVLCDIGEDWNMTAQTVEKAISVNTKAIIAVHTMGILTAIADIKKFGIPVIEDCCQAFGASVKDTNQETGIGDISIFSFHAIKCLTTGEGGLIATHNSGYFNRVKSICMNKSDSCAVSDIQASLGLSQLKKYDWMLEKRKTIAGYYFDKIQKKELTAKFAKQRDKSIFFRFLIESNADFEIVKKYFEDKGFAVRKGVDELLHKTYPQYATDSYPIAESVFNSTISLPIYPSLQMDDVEKIVTTINNYEAI